MMMRPISGRSRYAWRTRFNPLYPRRRISVMSRSNDSAASVFFAESYVVEPVTRYPISRSISTMPSRAESSSSRTRILYGNFMVSAGSMAHQYYQDPANRVPLSRHSKLYANRGFLRIFSEKCDADL